MDPRAQSRDFLVSRRAKVTPEQAGLPAYGGNRRVPGLRREEVAMLAGVSVDYYNRVERGNLHGVSDGVLESISRALQLDEAEHQHLLDLSKAANESPTRRRRTSPSRVTASMQQLLDSVTDAPAWIRNNRHDLVSANRLGYALYSEMLADPVQPANNARFVFLDPRSREFFVDWERATADIVAILRSEAGSHPHDRDLSNLIGELSTRSELFRQLWARHDVRFHRTGRKRLRHPVVGELDLAFEAMEFASDPSLTFLAYTAEPGSPTADALRLLATWAATQDAAAGSTEPAGLGS